MTTYVNNIIPIAWKMLQVLEDNTTIPINVSYSNSWINYWWELITVQFPQLIHWANNGVSVSTLDASKVVLGNDNLWTSATLTSNRQIPLSNYNLWLISPNTWIPWVFYMNNNAAITPNSSHKFSIALLNDPVNINLINVLWATTWANVSASWNHTILFWQKTVRAGSASTSVTWIWLSLWMNRNGVGTWTIMWFWFSCAWNNSWWLITSSWVYWTQINLWAWWNTIYNKVIWHDIFVQMLPSGSWNIVEYNWFLNRWLTNVPWPVTRSIWFFDANISWTEAFVTRRYWFVSASEWQTWNDTKMHYIQWRTQLWNWWTIPTAIHSNLIVSGSLAYEISTKTSAYTITASDHTILADGTFNITLPSAVGLLWRIHIIKNIWVWVITVDTLWGTIDWVSTRSLSTQYLTIKVQSDWTNRFII